MRTTAIDRRSWRLSVSLWVCLSRGFAVQTLLNGSTSCLGWRLLGARETMCQTAVPISLLCGFEAAFAKLLWPLAAAYRPTQTVNAEFQLHSGCTVRSTPRPFMETSTRPTTYQMDQPIPSWQQRFHCDSVEASHRSRSLESDTTVPADYALTTTTTTGCTQTLNWTQEQRKRDHQPSGWCRARKETPRGISVRLRWNRLVEMPGEGGLRPHKGLRHRTYIHRPKYCELGLELVLYWSPHTYSKSVGLSVVSAKQKLAEKYFTHC